MLQSHIAEHNKFELYPTSKEIASATKQIGQKAVQSAILVPLQHPDILVATAGIFSYFAQKGIYSGFSSLIIPSCEATIFIPFDVQNTLPSVSFIYIGLHEQYPSALSESKYHVLYGPEYSGGNPLTHYGRLIDWDKVD